MSLTLSTNKWDVEVVDRLAELAFQRASLRADYATLMDGADATTGLAMQLLLEDERRHQQLMVGLARAAGGDPQAVREPTPPADPELVLRARALREAEEGARRDLRGVRRLFPARSEFDFWRLVLDLLDADAARRITILTFVQRRAGDHLVHG